MHGSAGQPGPGPACRGPHGLASAATSPQPPTPPHHHGPVYRPHLASAIPLARAASAFQGWSQSGPCVSQPNGSLPHGAPAAEAARQGPGRRSPPNGSSSPSGHPLTCAGSHPPAPLRPSSARSRSLVGLGETTFLHASSSPRVPSADPLPAPVGGPRRRPRPCGRRARSQTLQLGDVARGRALCITSYDLEEAEARKQPPVLPQMVSSEPL